MSDECDGGIVVRGWSIRDCCSETAIQVETDTVNCQLQREFRGGDFGEPQVQVLHLERHSEVREKSMAECTLPCAGRGGNPTSGTHHVHMRVLPVSKELQTK